MNQITERHEESQAPQERAVRFSVCAVIDLQGFSSHLEISGYDLRTAIGEQATSRLHNLEEAIDRVRMEQARLSEYYPSGLHLQRINDAIIIAMDLDDILLPSVGQTIFRGLSAASLPDFFHPDELADEQGFGATYETRIQSAIEPLQQFLGIVSRVHLFAQKREGASCYPGAKTVVATGFRKPFMSSSQHEDVLSANFAFANAFSAERELSGPHFFVDNNIVELVSKNRFARHLLRFAHFHWREAAFDCLADDGGDLGPPSNAEVPKPLEVVLFRRRYLFRRLNASPMSYLQHLPSLAPFLSGSRVPDRSNRFYAHVYDAIKHGLSRRMIQESSPPPSFIYNGTNDLDTGVGVFNEFLATGTSQTQEARRKAQRLAELGRKELDDNSQLARELEALDQQEVTIDVEPLGIGDLGSVIWSLSEETLTALLPFMTGDMRVLDFPHESE